MHPLAAYVRVRPAFVGEGRYFVRVPPGTNSDRFVLQDDTVVVSEEDMQREPGEWRLRRALTYIEMH